MNTINRILAEVFGLMFGVYIAIQFAIYLTFNIMSTYSQQRDKYLSRQKKENSDGQQG